jgi:PAS domain S-box-containing protein
MAPGLQSLLHETAGLSRELLFEANPDGTLRTVNTAWTALLGWSDTELQGKTFFDLVHPDHVQKAREVLAGAAGHPSVALDARCRGKDGAYRSISWKLAARDGFVLGAGHAIAPGPDSQGIHDLNNLMQNIVGALELVRKLLATGRAAETERFITSAIASAHRAAELNQRRVGSSPALAGTNTEVSAAAAKL